MRPNYKQPFAAFVKKQRKALQLAIEDAIEDVCANPYAGEPKVGDLQGIRVYKFAHHRQQYLIAYRLPSMREMEREGGELALLMIDFYQVGAHENFYAMLKQYLKS